MSWSNLIGVPKRESHLGEAELDTLRIPSPKGGTVGPRPAGPPTGPMMSRASAGTRGGL